MVWGDDFFSFPFQSIIKSVNAEIGRKDSHWNKEAPSQKFLRGREGSAEENKDKEEEEEEGKMAVEKEEGEDGVEAVDMAEVRNFLEKNFFKTRNKWASLPKEKEDNSPSEKLKRLARKTSKGDLARLKKLYEAMRRMKKKTSKGGFVDLEDKKQVPVGDGGGPEPVAERVVEEKRKRKGITEFDDGDEGLRVIADPVMAAANKKGKSDKVKGEKRKRKRKRHKKKKRKEKKEPKAEAVKEGFSYNRQKKKKKRVARQVDSKVVIREQDSPLRGSDKEKAHTDVPRLRENEVGGHGVPLLHLDGNGKVVEPGEDRGGS